MSPLSTVELLRLYDNERRVPADARSVMRVATRELERLRKATGGLDPALVAKALAWLADCVTGAKWDCDALTAADIEAIEAATFGGAGMSAAVADAIGERVYTVDDLIAWLAERDWFPYELYPDPSFALESFDVYLRHISVPYDDEEVVEAWRRDFINVGGLTLLEALEKAVLEVERQP